MKELTDLFATYVGQLGLAGGQLIGNGGCGLPVRTLHHQLPVLGKSFIHTNTGDTLIHGLFQSICWQTLEKRLQCVFANTDDRPKPLPHVPCIWIGTTPTVQYSDVVHEG
jgi:hypothetical protein